MPFGFNEDRSKYDMPERVILRARSSRTISAGSDGRIEVVAYRKSDNAVLPVSSIASFFCLSSFTSSLWCKGWSLPYDTGSTDAGDYYLTAHNDGQSDVNIYTSDAVAEGYVVLA